jgi:hypothetical protein
MIVDPMMVEGGGGNRVADAVRSGVPGWTAMTKWKLTTR